MQCYLQQISIYTAFLVPVFTSSRHRHHRINFFNERQEVGGAESIRAHAQINESGARSIFQVLKMNTFITIVLLSLVFGACNSANVKNATLTTLPEAVADVSYKKNHAVFILIFYIECRELFAWMEAPQATTGEQLPKVVVPRTCGYSILREEGGAMTVLRATTEARPG